MNRIVIAIAMAALLAAPAARAQSCSTAEIGAVIDQTGARLRELNAESQPRLRGKLRELANKKGWPESDLEAKSQEILEDNEIRALDSQAGQLLDKLDRLGDDSLNNGAACQRLAEARTTAKQLIEVSSQRTAYAAARLEASLAPVAIAPRAEPKAAKAKPAPASPSAQKGAPVAWDTQTQRDAATAGIAPSAEALAGLPPAADIADMAFTAEDIRAAGRGFFGTISAGLASVIEYSFRAYGQPTGYILGTEGGAALIAGLRYGEGTLVTKAAGERKVYWQGPSVGYDIGLAGSRVMFLVYNIRDGEELFARFAGVDGSAYFVGGAGITFLKKGRLVLAPIRTGVGLRLGANVGYLKFTREPSLNPF